jgi:hypothetical protein
MRCSFSTGRRKGLTHDTAFQPERVVRTSSCHPSPYNWLSQSSWQVVTPATTMVTLLPWDSRPVGNPMFRSHGTFRRVRRSVRFLDWDHSPTLSDGRLLMPRTTSRVHPETASSVLRLVADWTAGSWNSGSLAFAIPPGLAEHRATTLSLFSAFVTCYCSRCLSARGKFHDLQHLSPMLTHDGNIVCRDMAHRMVRPIRSTSSSRLACSSTASRSDGLWSITSIATSPLVAPSSVWQLCRIRQSFSVIILPPRASARL